MDYKQMVIEAYSGGDEANRANINKYEMEFINTKKILDCYISKEKSVIEIGCGGGYYGMHYGPQSREYVGVDLSPVNIGIFSDQIKQAGLKNVSAQIGDATALVEIPNESYDVVLCLGPLYHLNRDDRKQCIRECRRICRPGGVIAFSFINKAGAMAKYGSNGNWEQILTPAIDECVINHGTDDVNTNIFYYTMPEELLQDTQAEGLSKIKMAGVDFLLLEPEIEKFTEEQRQIWFHFAELVRESEYATALCNHALLLCQKSISS